MAMNPEVKKQWLQALRSGQYKQGRNILRNYDNEFCCLGVLCNLHAQAHPDIAATQRNPTNYLGRTGLPPREVVLWAGLGVPDPEVVMPNGRQVSLSELNDGYGRAGRRRSFAAIANLIEEQL